METTGIGSAVQRIPEELQPRRAVQFAIMVLDDPNLRAVYRDDGWILLPYSQAALAQYLGWGRRDGRIGRFIRELGGAVVRTEGGLLFDRHAIESFEVSALRASDARSSDARKARVTDRSDVASDPGFSSEWAAPDECAPQGERWRGEQPDAQRSLDTRDTTNARDVSLSTTELQGRQIADWTVDELPRILSELEVACVEAEKPWIVDDAHLRKSARNLRLNGWHSKDHLKFAASVIAVQIAEEEHREEEITAPLGMLVKAGANHFYAPPRGSLVADEDQVEEVRRTWCEVTGRDADTPLRYARRLRVQAAVAEHGLTTVLSAIRGINGSSFYRGDDKPHDDLLDVLLTAGSICELAALDPDRPVPAAVQEVFDAWVCATGRDPQATTTTLDNSRWRAIEGGIEQCGLATVLAAVRGVTRSSWHMERPGRDELKIVLSDKRKIERLAKLGTKAAASDRQVATHNVEDCSETSI